MCARPQGRTRTGAAAKESGYNAFNLLDRKLPEARLSRFRATYRTAVASVRRMLTTVAPYERPVASRELHPFVQRDFPEIRRDKFVAGEVLDKAAFLAQAVRRVSPLIAADAASAARVPADLRLAIEYVERRGPRIVADRAARVEELRRLAASLAGMRAALDACKCTEAAAIAADFNVAWLALMTDAMDWPDVEQPLRYVTGHPVVFDVPDSGVFRAEQDAAEISKAEFMRNNTRMIAQISREIEQSALSGDSEKRERRKQCWIRTKEEIAEGLVGPPRSRAAMDRRFGRGKWRCLGRNAIRQKGKWRCIDNGKRSKHNKATTMHERITCGRADFPVMVAREFARQRAVNRPASERATKGVSKPIWRMRMQHGTNDLRAAYRHVPTSQPEFTNVAVWDADAGQVSYCEVPGHNFGLKSAVVNFNRAPEQATVFARRVLWVVSEHYYDDNDTTEPAYANGSGQACLKLLHSNQFLGFPFDDGKDALMGESNEYLGVVSSFERVADGILVQDVSRKRRGKLRDLVREVAKARELRSGLASSIFGKAGFMLSPCYSSLGRACLLPLKQREYERAATRLNVDTVESLEFIEFACDHLPAQHLPLLA